MPSPGYVNPNTPKGKVKARDRFVRDMRKHGKPTSRSMHDWRHRAWLLYLKRNGMRA